MPNYRRAWLPGGTFFFTLVTERRQRFLTTPAARELLHTSIADAMRAQPFTLDAIVLLPDHLHAIWTLPVGDADFSSRWSRIKSHFTRRWTARGGDEAPVSESRRCNRRRGVWQRRFWEHAIRDERDFERHLDYLLYNPVKHEVTTCPHAYPFSSFDKCVEHAWYPSDWCCACDGRLPQVPDFEWATELELE